MAKNSNKFNLTKLLNQRSMEAATQGQQEAEAQKDTTTDGVSATADIYDLIPSKDNFYSVEDVQDLKQSIELLGILQPLLVTNEENGKRRIIAGHRRRLAIMQLVDEGKERFRYVPIMVKLTKNAILDRLALIMTNRFREKTDWEKMTESIETEKLVQELKEQMDIPGRTRDLLAEIVDASPATLGRYKAIYNNLTEELMTEFKAGKIGVSVIYEVSGLEKEWQLKALEKYRENGTLALPDIKEIKKQQEAAAQVPGQMSMETAAGQQDTQETAQTGENAEGGENTGETENGVAEGAGEATEGQEAQGGFMNEPEEEAQPETFTSICYSCTKYETCTEKNGWTLNCNAYENRREAQKTDEDRYNEEQSRIDAETKRKLRERQQEETMRQGPAEKQHEAITLPPSRYEEITSGALSFLLLKKDGYKVGEELTLPEMSQGQQTGRTLEIKICYVWEDWTGLDDDFCIIGFQLVSYTVADAGKDAANWADQPTLQPGA